MATADERGNGIHIGSVQGAFAIGDHNTVTHNEGVAAPAVDPAQEELLRAVRELRDDLGRAVPGPQIAALTAELTDTEAEVKIVCGNRAMGYSLFHGIWEYFYEKVVFFF